MRSPPLSRRVRRGIELRSADRVLYQHARNTLTPTCSAGRRKRNGVRERAAVAAAAAGGRGERREAEGEDGDARA
jgi:hypothetical protein